MATKIATQCTVTTWCVWTSRCSSASKCMVMEFQILL